MYTDAIQKRSRVTLSELKDHLRLNPEDKSENTILSRYLKGAKGAADDYCGNPFLNEDGTHRGIPEAIENWILQKASSLYNVRSTGLQQVQDQNLTITLTQEDKKLLKPHWKGWI